MAIPLPKTLEYKEMIAQRDHCAIILWIFVIFVSPIIYLFNHEIDKGYLIIIELLIFSMAIHHRAVFLNKFDKAVNECFDKIFQDHYATKIPIQYIVWRIFSNATFNGIPISECFMQKVVQKINDRLDAIQKENDESNYRSATLLQFG